ncbi:MAG: aminotransferase class IV [Patescibacteria group bacterium]
MEKRQPIIWYLENKFIHSTDAKIPITDLGLQRGWGVFDFLRTYSGQPFQLSVHVARFLRSTKGSLINLNKSAEELTQLVNRLIARNSVVGSVGIKLFATAGNSRDGLTGGKKPTFGIMLLPLHRYPRATYTRGIKLGIYRELRTNPEVKSTNYAAVLVKMAVEKRRGFDDILYVGTNNVVYESARSNFFALINGTWITPKEGVLPGITRKLVIGLSRKRYPVREGVLTLAQLKKAGEAFITSTEREVMPVVKVGSFRIGNGRVGDKTKQLMADFHRFTLQ